MMFFVNVLCDVRIDVEVEVFWGVFIVMVICLSYIVIDYVVLGFD